MFAFLNRVFLCLYHKAPEDSFQDVQDDILSQDILDNIDNPPDLYNLVNTFPDLFKDVTENPIKNPIEKTIINEETSIKEHIIDLSRYLD